jgi:hypothetical protein
LLIGTYAHKSVTHMPLTKRIATNHTKDDDNIGLHRLDLLLGEDELAMRLIFFFEILYT